MKIKEEDIRKIGRAAGRLVELECGLRRPTHKVHKNKSKYYRKDKHKKNLI
jgi:hypothetical protein